MQPFDGMNDPTGNAINMNYPSKLVFLVTFLFFNCHKENSGTSKVLDFEVFTVEADAEWKGFTNQGIDSRVGGLSDGSGVLNFDYGWYSYNFNKETTETHLLIRTSIDGYPALIVRPKQKGKGIIGLYVEVGGANALSLYGENIQDEEEIIAIFNSVKFK